MGKYILYRIMMMLPVILISSIISFVVVQLPPGDFVDFKINELKSRGVFVSEEMEASLRNQYDLDQPVMTQYFYWMKNLFTGNLGYSMYYNQPVDKLLRERFPITALMAIISFLVLNLIAIPIGVLSAVKQYSALDYTMTVIGFLGLAVPNFIFSLVLMYMVFSLTGNTSVIGLMSQQYLDAPWSMAKFFDMLNHMWIPAIVTATAGTAAQIRLMRANLLDELEKPYVLVARAKGVRKNKLIYKYPFRVAINPFIVGLGGIFATLLSGELMVSVTLGLPTLAPVMVNAAMAQDMYLAGSIIFLETLLIIVGILMSDIVLGAVDPRIRDAV